MLGAAPQPTEARDEVVHGAAPSVAPPQLSYITDFRPNSQPRCSWIGLIKSLSALRPSGIV